MSDIIIQWYPGHMAKAKREIQAAVGLVDVLLELVDARIPASSRNPDIPQLAAGRRRLIGLTKTDLAEPEKTKAWIKRFAKSGISTFGLDLQSGAGVRELIGALERLGSAEAPVPAAIQKVRKVRPVRAIIVGIPNSGKSTLINRLAGRTRAKVGASPGVTRGRQWVRAGRLEVLDTPGILWPKFEDPDVGFKLAATGAIRLEVVDIQVLARRLCQWILASYPGRLNARYKVDEAGADPDTVLGGIARSRGLLQTQGRADLGEASGLLLREFRQGLLGPVTLDDPEEIRES